MLARLTAKAATYVGLGAIVACGKGLVPACLPDLRHALTITAVDSATDGLVPVATIIVAIAAYHSTDSIQVSNASRYPVFAGQAPGTYTVSIAAPNYQLWRDSVVVDTLSNVDGCTFPGTVSVEARLQREP